MTAEARLMVDAAISEVAPDLDPGAFALHDELRATARLDSLDFLHVLAAIHQSCGVDVPETDYAQVATYGGLVDYVQAAMAER
jgi:acyl carrier protein